MVLEIGPYDVLLMNMGYTCRNLIGQMTPSERTALARIVLEVVQILPQVDLMLLRNRTRDPGIVLGFQGLDDCALGWRTVIHVNTCWRWGI